MRRPGIIILAIGLGIVGSARADRGEEEVRGRLDAAVNSAREGGLGVAADDATFLRRAWLDLAGHVPPGVIAREFLDDKDPEKRARAVDRLLESDDFADHWGRVLASWATSQRPVANEKYDGRVLQGSIKEALLAKVPYDRVVRDLLAGSGASDASGPANFLLRYDADPPKLAGAVGKNFLGVTIQCAQCHDHPFARWKEDDFWGLAAAFARVRSLEGRDDLKAVVEARKGELMRPPAGGDGPDRDDDEEKSGHDEKEKPDPKQVAVKPRTLDGKTLAGRDRRASLADWVVARDNPRFARNLVNRSWDQFFGTAPVPDLDNPRAVPVLDLLAEDFAAHGHDLRRLLRIVVLSRAYGQTSSTRAKPPWSGPSARPMTVDQLYATVAQATGHVGEPAEVAEPPEDGDVLAEAKGEEENNPGEEDKADPAGEALGERAMTLQRALVLLNSEFIRDASRSAVKVSRSLLGKKDPASQVEWACLATLCRRPSVKEAKLLAALLAEPGGAEDVYWVLLNSSEFQVIR